MYDRFYDYWGQSIYDSIQLGEKIDEETLKSWKCKDENEFLETWRSNSDEEFEKWKKDNGYE